MESILFSPNSNPYDLSFEKWTEKWWIWLLSQPKSFNPALDATGAYCAVNQSDENVWFLAGTLGGINVKRTCIVPDGKAILLPIIIDEQSFAEKAHFRLESELESFVKKEAESVIEMKATIDNTQLSTAELKKFCRVGTRPFNVTLPEDNIWGVKAGPTRAAGDGYWLFLKPLERGEHKIYFFGRGSHFTTEVTYELKMGPRSI